MAGTGAVPRVIAVDWGTTRLRATLLDAGGRVLDRAQSDEGVQSVAAGGFPAALAAVCEPWLTAHAALPVIMCGMVGSRNGWVEAPYAHCPCGVDEIARAIATIPGQEDIRVVPGVDCRWPDGAYDVMRGEETKAIGTGIVDGLLCMPGTHSKWVEMVRGRIDRFATFVTGELFAVATASFLGRLAEEPADEAGGEAAGAAASRRPGGLMRALFQARAQVLGGAMSGRQVRPFLSRLLIETEIAGALALFGGPPAIALLAGDPQRGAYEAAFAARGIAVRHVDPAEAATAGLSRLMAARSRQGET